MHDWNENVINVTSYTVDDASFSGTLHFKFVDTFGLNEKDIVDDRTLFGPINYQYGLEQGFRSWYILQHYNQYKGQYMPFNTVVEYDVDFYGTINKACK